MTKLDFSLWASDPLRAYRHGELRILRLAEPDGVLVYDIGPEEGVIEFADEVDLEAQIKALQDASGQLAYKGPALVE